MMTLHRNVFDILKGSSTYLASAIISSVAPFLISLLVSRYLGKEALGIFSVCFALILAGVLVSDLGLNSFIVREFAGQQKPLNVNLQTLLIVRMGASLVTALAIIAVTLFFISSPDSQLLSTAAFGLIVLRSVAGALENVLKARLYRATYAAVTIGSSIVHVALVYSVLNAGHGIERVFLMMTGVEILKTVILMWILRNELTTPGKETLPTVKRLGALLQQGLPFALIGVFTFVNDKAALFLLAAICGNAEAGIFSAADRFLIVGVLLDSSLFASALPVLSLFRERSHVDRVTKQTMVVVSIAAIVGTMVLFVGAPWLINLTFRYAESIGLLRILSLSLPALLLGSVVRIALFSMHEERRVAIAFGITSLISILLNAMFIPFFRSAGAAAITVIMEYGLAFAYGVFYFRCVRSVRSPITTM
ncbi:MAG: polysaccharide biosynthesis protein [Bacteroidetes bacterium]|nr:polysaccharide biosynthesis protein [Bacteroidota bacterium]